MVLCQPLSEEVGPFAAERQVVAILAEPHFDVASVGIHMQPVDALERVVGEKTAFDAEPQRGHQSNGLGKIQKSGFARHADSSVCAVFEAAARVAHQRGARVLFPTDHFRHKVLEVEHDFLFGPWRRRRRWGS